MNQRIRTMLIGLVAALLAAACGGSAKTEPEPIACAQVIGYAEPVVKLVSASNLNTKAAISDISVSNIQLNGQALDLQLHAQVQTNVVVSGNTIACKIACGFATEPGSYAMTVSAPGYQSSVLKFDASYSSFSPGCGGNYSGGTEVALVLSPL